MSLVVRFLFLTVLTPFIYGLPTTEPDTTQFQCPLEYPMKERNGQIRRCKPIGSPFCPDTHFCKMDTQQEPGICCLKNVLGKLQEVETNKEKRTEGETQTTQSGFDNNCRPFDLLPLKSPDCRYEPRKVLDSNGCPMPPTIVCTSEENDCPAISLPVLSSLCKFGPSKNGSNGCPIAPDIICEAQESIPKPPIQSDPQVLNKGSGKPEASSSTVRAPVQPPSAPQQPNPQPSGGAQQPASPPLGAPPAAQPGAPQPLLAQSGPAQSGASQNSPSTPPPPPPPQQTRPNSQSPALTQPPQAPAQPVPGSQPQQLQGQSPPPPPPAQPSPAQPSPAQSSPVQPSPAQPSPAQPTSNQQQQQQPAQNGSQPAAAKPVQPLFPVNPVVSASNSNETQSIVSQIASSFNETTEEPPRNFTFEEMLGNDFLHALNRTEMPQPTDFRRKFGPPMNASGKFHACKIHADCFQFREPAEWCRPKNNIRWNEKSCFCATDTMTPSCIVERTDGDKTEWTFCSSFTDLKCS